MPRLFVALELPTPIKHLLLELRRPMQGAHWQSAAQMHLTLQFIGDVETSKIAEIKAKLAEITAEPLALKISGVDYFGSKNYPRVLFAKLEPNPALLRLQKQIAKALTALDIELEKQKYSPHITLARLEQTPYPQIAQFLQTEALLKSEDFMLSCFQLFSSRLKPTGSEYTVEAMFPLVLNTEPEAE